jgi:hypothetical protein
LKIDTGERQMEALNFQLDLVKDNAWKAAKAIKTMMD